MSDGRLNEIAKIYKIANGVLVMDMQGVISYHVNLDAALEAVKEIGSREDKPRGGAFRDWSDVQDFLDAEAKKKGN